MLLRSVTVLSRKEIVRMKKKYEYLECEVVRFEEEDVITASGVEPCLEDYAEACGDEIDCPRDYEVEQ